ncbi:MAG: DotH/IcmK family type IV secretion protein [Bdellovibrionales bacterium]
MIGIKPLLLGAAIICNGMSLVIGPSAWASEPPSLAAAVDAVVSKNNKDSSSENATNSSSGIDLPDESETSDIPALDDEQLRLEQQALEAAERAAREQAKQEEEFNRESYKQASDGLMPLSSEQIRSFMKRLETTQEASQAPSGGAPKGEVKVANLSLDPGKEPPQINLAAGYVTTIDIIDQTGEPWPILDVGVGGNFEVTPTQAGSHVVRVVPLTRVGTGNLSILVKGLSTPLIFRLASGGSSFHMRYDARVPALGPMARTPLIKYRHQGPVAGDELMSMLLENAPPSQAKRLKVGGLDARTKAWQVGERVYVRTPLSLLSPAWNASVSSADGMTVYEIGDAPVLLMSDNGAMIRARLLREDTHDN